MDSTAVVIKLMRDLQNKDTVIICTLLVAVPDMFVHQSITLSEYDGKKSEYNCSRTEEDSQVVMINVLFQCSFF